MTDQAQATDRVGETFDLDGRLRLVFEGREDPVSANVAADEIRQEINRLRDEMALSVGAAEHYAEQARMLAREIATAIQIETDLHEEVERLRSLAAVAAEQGATYRKEAERLRAVVEVARRLDDCLNADRDVPGEYWLELWKALRALEGRDG